MSEDHSALARSKHPHVRRALLAASASVATLVMVISAAGMGAYFWTRDQIHTIPSVAGASGPTSGQPDIAGICDERACNYLLLGSDSRAGLPKDEQVQFGTDEDIGGLNRSDTIILVHTDPDAREATFLSFPRDLWVDIPGEGMGKINSAFEGGIEGGGAQRVARTVRELTGLRIHHVMYVDLAGFQRVVDALGGVDLCIPSYQVNTPGWLPQHTADGGVQEIYYGEPGHVADPNTGLDVTPGCQHLDGTTALAYVRTRSLPCDSIPDFARIGRQQQFMRAVISELLSPTRLLSLPDLIPELLKGVVVDQGLKNPAELVYLAGTLEGVTTGAADFRSVPSVPDELSVNGQLLSIVRAVEPDATKLFNRIGAGLPLGDLGKQLPAVPPSPATIAVAVAGHGGSASAVLDVLTEGGFNTAAGVIGKTAVTSPGPGSMIVYRDGLESEAQVVASFAGGLDIVPVPASALPAGVDVAVVVTNRYEIPTPDPAGSSSCP
jgi:anionic cell wall polymer biosynthesis LytR-Cps2A-Psr (LCP) family protein